MSGWRRCQQCRKVKQVDEYDAGVPKCRACLTTPAPRNRAAPVTRTVAPKPAPAPEPGPRAPLLGAVGMGDLEVRERRAKRAAYEQLAEMYADEFEDLLQAARRAEGLRT